MALEVDADFTQCEHPCADVAGTPFGGVLPRG